MGCHKISINRFGNFIDHPKDDMYASPGKQDGNPGIIASILCDVSLIAKNPNANLHGHN